MCDRRGFSAEAVGVTLSRRVSTEAWCRRTTSTITEHTRGPGCCVPPVGHRGIPGEHSMRKVLAGLFSL